MTAAALQARVRSLELDGSDYRKALDAVEATAGAAAERLDALSVRVDALESAGGAAAAKRLEQVEARVGETTRMQLELAALDDRIEALEDRASAEKPSESSDASDAREELLSLDGRVGALEATVAEGPDVGELRRRLEAAEVGLADAQQALAATRAELRAREEAQVALLERLAALEARLESAAAVVVHAPVSEPADSDYPTERPASVPLTAVKGIGPKLSQKLRGAGLDDAASLALLDEAGLDALAERSGIKRGRLVRLRTAARSV